MDFEVINGRYRWAVNGLEHSVRVHQTANPWFHHTITVQEGSEEIYINNSSLIKFLRTTSQGNHLEEESLSHKICSCFGSAGSSDGDVQAAWQSYRASLLIFPASNPPPVTLSSESENDVSIIEGGEEDPLADNPFEDACTGLLDDELHLIANQAGNAIQLTLGESSYFIWCHPATREITIEVESANAPRAVFACIRPNHSIQLSNPNQEAGVVIDILEAIHAHVDQIKTQQEQLNTLSTRFNPDCLKLLHTFFSGPRAVNLRYREGQEQKSAMTLNIGDTLYRVWVRIGNNGAYYFNVQDNDNYGYGIQDNKLGICMDGEGNILSVYINGAQAVAEDFEQQLFAAEGAWNLRMTQILNAFLFAHAVNITPQAINVHAMALQQIPERVARAVFDQRPHGLSAQANVNFLQDSFNRSLGIDAGGPTNDFISLLSRHLLDGAPSRVIRMSSGLPVYQDSDECRESLALVGRLFAQCIQYPDQITGRLLPDRYFNMLVYLIQINVNINTALTDEQKLNAISRLLTGDASIPDWLRAHATSNPAVTEEQQDYINDILALEVDNGDYHAAIQEYLLDAYDSTVIAARHISNAIPQAQRQQIAAMGYEPLSTQIQGHSFNRVLIANRITVSYVGQQHPILIQKAAWLKEHIQDPNTPQAWVEQFLQTVTGQPNLCGSYSITIQPAADEACHAHTCFRSIEVPTMHTALGSNVNDLPSLKQQFLNNLQITMDQSGYDMG